MKQVPTQTQQHGYTSEIRAILPVAKGERPWILLAAYDVSVGTSSEGYVAFNVLRRLAGRYRIILVTRRNNRERLLAGPVFVSNCPGVRIIGFDLPEWARWWKRGASLYQVYAYLWQLAWPLFVCGRKQLSQSLKLTHVLNFHNDSIPSLAWVLGRPVVWGPINHHELCPRWRREFWPASAAVRHYLSFLLRRVAWRLDPLLRLTVRKAAVILSAGVWVDKRLGLGSDCRLVRLSQLGVDAADFPFPDQAVAESPANGSHLLLYAGRLDWLKGVDLAIEALARLPAGFKLLLIGDGPAEARLKRLVAERRLIERVEFRPSVSRSELACIYGEADLFLFTSPEVAGLGWIEALACGLPVVGFAGETELSSVGSSIPGIYLVKEADGREEAIEGFARIIAFAVSGAVVGTRDRMVIRESVLARYGWHHLVEMIELAYRKAHAAPR